MHQHGGRAAAVVVAGAVLAGGLIAAAAPAYADTGGIVISELNYHAGSDLDTDDFVELTNASAAPVDLSGWTFTAGVTGAFPAGTVVAPGGYVVAAKDAARFQLLHGVAPTMVYGGNLSNGGERVAISDTAAVVVDEVTYADATPWPPAPDGTGPSLELRGLGYDNTLPESWGPSLITGGTPFARNSIDGTVPSPRAAAVTATPRRPAPGQDVVVSARLPLGATAVLRYKVMFAADVSVPFLDDAASPGGAGDGVYAASVPGQAAGKLIRYRIEGTTSAGIPFAHPVVGDSISYEGVVVTNPAVATPLPVIEWFMDDAVYDDLLANHRYDDVGGPAVIAYNGIVYDNASMRVRGQSTRALPKVNWKVEMPAGYNLDLGPLLPYTLDEWALQRDPDPLADIGWQTVREAGGRSLAITPVRSQRNGEFWGLGRAMELEDGTWRDAQGVSSRAIYKGDNGGLQKTASPQALQDLLWLDKKTRETEDYSDVWSLSQATDAPFTPAQRAWLYANVNVPELVNYLAINAVIRHQDSNYKNWFITRDTEGTGRWEMWHWDLNWIFTTPAEDNHGEYLVPVTSNRFLATFMAQSEFKEMFFRRLRTLADQFLAPGRYEARWEALAAPSVGDWALETAKWGGRGSAAARAKFDEGLADRRNVIINNTGPGKPVPPSQTSTPNVVISEIQYAPTAGTDAEFVELTNPSLAESVDVSGWQIEGLGLTIPPGTVLLPGAQVVVVKNDNVFRSVYGADQRLVAAEYPTALPDTGATLRLLQGSRVVDEVTYGSAAPWPTAAGTGPSLELADPFLDNALPSSWSATSSAGGTPGRPNTAVLPTDTSAPTAPSGLASSNVGPTSVTVSWSPSTDDRGVAGYRVVRNGVELALGIPSTTFTDTGLTAGATYQYAVKALDGTGNVSAASPALTVTTSPSDPVLYSDAFPEADGSAWVPSWVSGAGSGGSVTQSGGTGQLAVSATSGSFGRAALSGLAARAASDTLLSYRFSDAGAVAYFSVFARGSGGWQNAYRPMNGYGLELSSSSSSVAVKRNVAGTATTLATVAGARVVGTGKQWLRLRVSGSTIQFRTWVDGATEPSTWASTVTDATVTAPGQLFVSLARGGTTTTAKYVAIDDLRVVDPTLAAPDTTPPSAPTALVASAVSSTQATVSWTASTDDRGVAGYRVLRDGVLLPGTVLGTSFTDTGLTASTTYSYRVRAVDTSGLVSADSVALPVTTSSAPDVTPPSVPGGLTASAITPGGLTLSWTASTDDRGVAGYRVLRDGVLLPGTVAGTSFTDTGLTASTTYSYRVRAVDTSGLVSGDSAALPVTTSAADPSLFSDLFPAADGSPWSSSWTATSGNGGSVTQAGGTGRLAISATSGSFGRAALSGLAARTGTDTMLSYRFSDAGAVAYFSVFARGSGGWQNAYRPVNGYGLELNSSSATVTLKRNVAGTVTNLASVSGARVVGTGKQWLRLRVSGSTIQFRTWVDGAVEPSTWAATVTDTSVTAPGQLFVSLARGGTTTTAKYVALDDVRVVAAP